MLTLDQLLDILKLNEALLLQERRTDRMFDLILHRSLVKDCIIELLMSQKNTESKVA